MRVLLVTHGYPPFGVTGVERASERTAQALTAGGDEIRVLTRRDTAAPPIPRLERTSHGGVEVSMVIGGGAMHGKFPHHTPVLERLFEREVLDFNPEVVLIGHLFNPSPRYLEVARRL